ncbi:histone H2B type 1-A-like [Cetorhinus maximus]
MAELKTTCQDQTGAGLKQSLAKVTKKPPKKWRKSRKLSYSTYVYRVLTQAHPSSRILSKGTSVMNFFIVDIFEHITSEVWHLIHYNKRSSISARKVQSAVCLILPGELATHAITKGAKVVTKYTNSI